MTGRPDDVLVQDTSWPGYTQIPRWIVDGYSTLFREIDDQIGGAVDSRGRSHRGGITATGGSEHYRSAVRPDRPAVLAVEPARAACVTASLAAGRPVTVDTSSPTEMAGLNCGTVSEIAWPVISAGLDAAVGVSEDQARSALTDLHTAGRPGRALRGRRTRRSPGGGRRSELSEALGLDARSIVVLISTEGIAEQ